MTPREVVTIVTVGNQSFDANQKNHEYIHMTLGRHEDLEEEKHNIRTKYVLLLKGNNRLGDNDMVGKLHDHDEDIVISGDNVIVKNNIFQEHTSNVNRYFEVNRLVSNEHGYTVGHI
tara:strand:+ start:97 stop:447 length:351 start_codon:yes stop_codon:yes gene_type:complete